jgi:hypothetical protein
MRARSNRSRSRAPSRRQALGQRQAAQGGRQGQGEVIAPPCYNPTSPAPAIAVGASSFPGRIDEASIRQGHDLLSQPTLLARRADRRVGRPMDGPQERPDQGPPPEQPGKASVGLVDGAAPAAPAPVLESSHRASPAPDRREQDVSHRRHLRADLTLLPCQVGGRLAKESEE